MEKIDENEKKQKSMKFIIVFSKSIKFNKNVIEINKIQIKSMEIKRSCVGTRENQPKSINKHIKTVKNNKKQLLKQIN